MLCDFPAEALLNYRRTMARKADETDDPYVKRKYMQSMLVVEQLRIDHEEIWECECWYEAVRSADAELAAKRNQLTLHGLAVV